MSKVVLSVDSASDSYEAGKVMLNEQGGYVLVENNDTVIGIITLRDFVGGILEWKAAPADIKVRHIMSSPVLMIDPESSIKEAAALMSEKKVRQLPVLHDEKIIGIVFSSDLAKLLGRVSQESLMMS